MKNMLYSFFTLSTLKLFLIFNLVPETFAGGGKSKKAQQSPCEIQKARRQQKCKKFGQESRRCKFEQEEQDLACKEETAALQAVEEKKKQELAAKDTEALSAIDAHIAKIVQIRDQANSVKGQVNVLYSQLEADSKNGCISNEDYSKKKSSALSSAQSLRTNADKTVEPENISEASIEALLQKINVEVAKVSQYYQTSAISKRDIGQRYANEAKSYTTQMKDYIAKTEELSHQNTSCSVSSSSNSSSSFNSQSGSGRGISSF